MKSNDFLSLVGNTPLVQYPTDLPSNTRVWIKLEGCNPTGSVKDRACLYNIKGALEDGVLMAGKCLLDASSGNMASALAYFGAVMGYAVEVVCSSKLTNEKAAFMKYYGAKLHIVGQFTIEGTDYCRDNLVPSAPDRYVFLDQLHNWNNPRAHYETTGPEILADIPNPAVVIGSLGSGGTMNGTARYIKEKNPQTRIVVVEAASGTKIPGTGAFVDGDYITPFITTARETKLFDKTCQTTRPAAFARARELASKGFFCGPQTGGVVDAALSVIRNEGITGDVVVISGDAGWKNMDALIES